MREKRKEREKMRKKQEKKSELAEPRNRSRRAKAYEKGAWVAKTAIVHIN